MMSSAILPSEPVTSARKFTASAKPSRATCQVETGTPRPSSLAERLLHLEPLVAERGQRAGGAGELADQHARLQLREPFGVAVEHREPDRGLVAERHRQRLLQMGAAGHRRVAIALRQIGEDAAQRRRCRASMIARPARNLQHHGGIHDVLRGRAPMHIAAGLAALLHHLMHQRQDRIADDVGLAAQQIEIERRDIGPRRRFRRRPPAGSRRSAPRPSPARPRPRHSGEIRLKSENTSRIAGVPKASRNRMESRTVVEAGKAGMGVSLWLAFCVGDSLRRRRLFGNGHSGVATQRDARHCEAARDKITKQFSADVTKQSELSPPRHTGLLRSARNDGRGSGGAAAIRTKRAKIPLGLYSHPETAWQPSRDRGEPGRPLSGLTDLRVEIHSDIIIA